MPSASETPRTPTPPATSETPDLEDRPVSLDFDWLTEIAIPLGVFGLLGSLVYYLIEVRTVLSGGASVGPLRWVVVWFLLATIGIARIRTKYGGAAIAGYYSALLAGSIGLFVWVYTGQLGPMYGGAADRTTALIFNWAMVGLIWWAATAVTREATLEENVETQLEGGLWSLLADEWQYPDQEDKPEAPVDSAQVRPRHPGRLVLWVSLAALLLFAVGQRTVGAEREHARMAFICMSLYVLFALLLLALTNLSALRMSVRRRGISLSPAVTPAWIVASTAIVAAIVIFAAVMPREIAEARERMVLQRPSWLSDSGRRGVDQGPTEGMGRRGDAPGGRDDERVGRADDERGEQGTAQGADGGASSEDSRADGGRSGNAPRGNSEPAEGRGRRGDASRGREGQGAERAGDERGEQSTPGGDESSGSGEDGDEDSAGTAGTPPKDDEPGEDVVPHDEAPDSPDGQAPERTEEDRGEQAAAEGDEEGGEGGDRSSGGEGEAESDGEGTDSGEDAEQARSERESQQPRQPQPPDTSGVARIILWILAALAAAAVLFFLVSHRHRVLAVLRWLLLIPGYFAAAIGRAVVRFLALLSNIGFRTRGARAASGLPADPFVDIFARGLADDLEPAQVIDYVYRAFQAYMDSQGFARADDQTALEFLRAIPRHELLPERAAERLTRAYVLATYSPREVTAVQVAGAQETWRLMRDRLAEARGR